MCVCVCVYIAVVFVILWLLYLKILCCSCICGGSKRLLPAYWCLNWRYVNYPLCCPSLITCFGKTSISLPVNKWNLLSFHKHYWHSWATQTCQLIHQNDILDLLSSHYHWKLPGTIQSAIEHNPFIISLDLSTGRDSHYLARFPDWFTWCQSCRHGGHAEHMAQWYK